MLRSMSLEPGVKSLSKVAQIHDVVDAIIVQDLEQGTMNP